MNHIDLKSKLAIVHENKNVIIVETIIGNPSKKEYNTKMCGIIRNKTTIEVICSYLDAKDSYDAKYIYYKSLHSNTVLLKLRLDTCVRSRQCFNSDGTIDLLVFRRDADKGEFECHSLLTKHKQYLYDFPSPLYFKKDESLFKALSPKLGDPGISEIINIKTEEQVKFDTEGNHFYDMYFKDGKSIGNKGLDTLFDMLTGEKLIKVNNWTLTMEDFIPLRRYGTLTKELCKININVHLCNEIKGKYRKEFYKVILHNIDNTLLAEFDIPGFIFSKYNNKKLSINDIIAGIYEDKDGRLLAMIEPSLDKFPYKRFIDIHTEEIILKLNRNEKMEDEISQGFLNIAGEEYFMTDKDSKKIFYSLTETGNLKKEFSSKFKLNVDYYVNKHIYTAIKYKHGTIIYSDICNVCGREQNVLSSMFVIINKKDINVRELDLLAKQSGIKIKYKK
jgi:hypothetical protein